MKQWPKLKPAPWDCIVVAVILALALLGGAKLWLGQENEAVTVVVLVNGQETERFAPDVLQREAKTYSNNGYTLTVAPGTKDLSSLDGSKKKIAGIRVAESDCPTQDCVHTGIVSHSGQSIVCLPARIVIQLVGGADSGLDAVLG